MRFTFSHIIETGKNSFPYVSFTHTNKISSKSFDNIRDLGGARRGEVFYGVVYVFEGYTQHHTVLRF